MPLDQSYYKPGFLDELFRKYGDMDYDEHHRELMGLSPKPKSEYTRGCFMWRKDKTGVYFVTDKNGSICIHSEGTKFTSVHIDKTAE